MYCVRSGFPLCRWALTLEELIHTLVQVNPAWIYVFIGSVAFIENIFPPFPSDVAIVAVGSLTGVGSVNFALALLCSTTGSTIGFVTMYKLGGWFGRTILERGKITFIPLDQVHKVEKWFHRYGYWVVIGNRFLSGTRAVVSVFAGLSDLSLLWCTILSLVSALIWNGILLYSGKVLGDNWKDISVFLEAYGKAATSILILLVLVLVGRYIYKRHAKPDGTESITPKPPVP